MPKIIPDVRNRILDSARKQLGENGYTGLSLRGVAEDCQIAVGTTYNYFPSKAALVAAVMESDWNDAIQEIDDQFSSVTSITSAICSIYRTICKFSKTYWNIFSHAYEVSTNNEPVKDSHDKLMENIKNKLQEIMEKFGYSENDSFMTLISQTLLYAAIQNHKEEDIQELAERLFPEKKG